MSATLSPEAEDKLVSLFRDSDPEDLARRITAPGYVLGPSKIIPVQSGTDVVDVLSPALGQLGYDGTTGHSRGRQSGFWWRSPEWRPVEISAVVASVDAVLRSRLAAAIDVRAQFPEWKRVDPGWKARQDAHELRIGVIEAVRKFVTSGGHYRGQLVSALRDSGEFDLSSEDVLDIGRQYLRIMGQDGRAQLAGLARSALAG